jgi:H+/gluconate symporter-like permease
MHNNNFDPVAANKGFATAGEMNQGYQKFDEGNPQVQVSTTKASKDSWKLWVKILSIVMIVVGLLGLLLNAFNEVMSIVNYSELPEETSTSYGQHNVPLNGWPGLVQSFLNLLVPLLYLLQGYFTYQTTQKDSSIDTGKMVSKVCMFLGAHVVVQFVKTAFLFFVTSTMIDEHQEDNKDFTEDHADSAKTLMLSIIITGALYSICSLFCCCGSVWGMHYFYKKSQMKFEDAQKNLNTGTPAPVVDQKLNQMV